MNIRIGRVEKVFAGLLIAYILLSFLPVEAPFRLLLKLIASFVGAWAFVRITGQFVLRLLWRLRNRLIVAYVFIALVPVVLISLLAGLGMAFVGGQFSIFLITSELERRTTALRTSTDYLVSHTREKADWLQNVAPYMRMRFPGLELTVEDGGRWLYPADSQLERAPAAWKPGSGLLVRGGLLYGWAHSEQRGRRVTALFPVTREFLGELAPEMCESTIMNLVKGRVLLHPSLDEAPPSRNRLPPAVNMVDFVIPWGAPMPVSYWDEPAKVDNEWLTVRTRPSAVLRTVFAQKVDLAADLIPTLFFLVAILFLIAEVIALFVGVSITRTITCAVHDLYEGTLRARSGDFSHRIPINGGDQLAELSVSFNEMTGNMQRLLAIEKERERLQAELEIAREVQNQLYPKSVPDVQTLRVTAACNPARMVSGDYYDYQQIGPDKVAIAIGDVAGKGISAALLMATVQSSFRSQIRGSLEMAVSAGQGGGRISVSTSALVSHLNKQLYADTAPEKYATFFLGVYDESTSSLTYTNAGHLPPVLVHKGTARRLDVNGMVVGAFPFAAYGESHVALEPADLVLFFTDGITEPENEYGEQFGEDRLVDLVIKYAHLGEDEIISKVMEAVGQWTGAGELQDDMTLLLVRRR